jgi:hypothetical protein
MNAFFRRASLALALLTLLVTVHPAMAQPANTFANTGSMQGRRYGHAATLLPNGKVLVFGGNIDNNMGAEIYDPATGTWTISPEPGTFSASKPTATMLPNSKVLIVGQGDPELYNSANGTWTVLSDPTGMVRRTGHTATLLPNGKVLIAAGDDPYLPVMLYDPASETFAPTGNFVLGAHIYYATATLLANGKVLMIGGYDEDTFTPLGAETYDPASGTWTAVNNFPTDYADYHTATLLANGKVLIVPYSSTSARLYDPSNGTLADATMSTAQSGFTATLMPNGKVLVAGGFAALAQIYDPSAGWSATGSLNVGRSSHTATLLANGQVLVAGGYTISSVVLASAELFEPGRPTATTGVASSVNATAATLNGTVNANGANTTVTFQYGTTASYTGGTATAAQSPLSAAGDTAVSAAISGLAGHTLYHFRVVGTTSAGTTNGADATFTTANTDPSAPNGSATGTTGDAKTVTVTFPVTDADGDAVAITEVAEAESTGLTVGSFTGTTVTFTPDAAFTGNGSFTYTVGDGFGGAATGTVTVTVTDNDAPVVEAHENVGPIEATGPGGATVFYNPGIATDNVTESPAMTHSKNSGTVFPIGVTTVTITATDSALNVGTGTFTVTVRDTTAPVVVGHEDVGPIEAVGPGGAVVTYAAGSATDAVTGSPAISYSKNSGTVFPVGLTDVTIFAEDAAHNIGTRTFQVWVRDSTPPVVTLTGANPLTVEAAATYTDPGATASDAVTSNQNLSLRITSNTVVANVPGTYAVTWTAADFPRLSITGSATRTVHVVDTTAPVVAAHVNVGPIEATGPGGATVTYAAGSATDFVTASPAISYSKNSGTIFPVGVTTVTIYAEDAAHNIGTGTFTVTVQDTTAPVVAVHTNVTVPATSGAGAIVTYAAGTATDAVTISPAITYSQNSGTLFPIGTTTVTIFAEDAAHNIGTGTFTVTVENVATATLNFATGNLSARPVDHLAQPNVIDVSVLRTDGLTGAVGATVVPSPPATVSGGNAKYVYGTDYEFVSGTSAGAPVSFADNQASAVVQVRLKTPALSKKGQFKLTLVSAPGGPTIGSQNVELVTILPRDAAKPLVTIIAPTAATTSVAASFDVSGTVRETDVLFSFKVKLNGVEILPLAINPLASFVPNTPVNFSATALAPQNGTNTLVVEAVDASGNITTVTRTLTYTNSRPVLAGTYVAVLAPATSPDVSNTGLVTATVTATGSFTGKVSVDGLTVAFSGLLTNEGVATFKPALKTTCALFDRTELDSYLGALAFKITSPGGMPTMAGDLFTDDTETESLGSYTGAVDYNKTSPPTADQAGSFNLTFPSSLDDESHPQGAAAVRATVTTTGAVSFAGFLADGTKLSAASRLRRDNTVPLYAPLYRKLGDVIGDLSFTARANDDVHGAGLLWFRPVLPKAQYYPHGWPTGISFDALGVKYVYPAALNFTQGSVVSGAGNASLAFELGANTTNKAVSIDPGTGAVKMIPAAGAGYNLSFAPKTGLFSGSFLHTDGKMTAYRGILLNKGTTHAGYGYFLSTPPVNVYHGSGQSGNVSLLP